MLKMTDLVCDALLVGSLLLVLSGSAAGEDCHRGLTDGCSVPDGLPRWYSRVFTEACYKHDQCYSCGVLYKFDLDRRECDDLFRDNMADACVSLPLWLRRSCRAARDVYYFGVLIGGAPSYNTEAEDWCEQSWVENCLV